MLGGVPEQTLLDPLQPGSALTAKPLRNEALNSVSVASSRRCGRTPLLRSRVGVKPVELAPLERHFI
jgi:hypothetical protein